MRRASWSGRRSTWTVAARCDCDREGGAYEKADGGARGGARADLGCAVRRARTGALVHRLGVAAAVRTGEPQVYRMAQGPRLVAAHLRVPAAVAWTERDQGRGRHEVRPEAGPRGELRLVPRRAGRQRGNHRRQGPG